MPAIEEKKSSLAKRDDRYRGTTQYDLTIKKERYVSGESRGTTLF